MKNLNNYTIMLLLSAFGIAFTSCDEDLAKADYDYKPNGALTLSTLRFDELKQVSDEAVLLHATIVNAGQSEIYDQGFIYSNTENFANYDAVSVTPDTLESGEVVLALDDYKITQGRDFYFKVYALTKDGLAVSSDVKTIRLAVTWVTVGSGNLTDNTFSGDTYEVELQKFEGANRYRLVDPFATGTEQYLVFELDDDGNALQDKMTPGSQNAGADGYLFYWHPSYVGTYCTFANTANVYTINFLLLQNGSLYTGGNIIFKWIEGYPGEIPEPKLSDFNALAYDDIPGAVRDFTSTAYYGKTWSQSFSKAVDLDPANADSQYKNLYYLSDLYYEGYGLAFYYDGQTIRIPENQPTGTTFKQPLFVSQSENIESSAITTARGVTIYTLGLNFHYEDGTSVGEFTETFYYSENPITYGIADFCGNFKLTGTSQFQDGTDADMNVVVTAGTEANTLVITGIDYAEKVIAAFNPASSTMSIAPQVLDDFIYGGNSFDMTLYTTDAEGNLYTPDDDEVATVDFNLNILGNLVMSPASSGDGYLLRSEEAGGWIDGYYNMLFTYQPAVRSSSTVAKPVKVLSQQWVAKPAKQAGKLLKDGNFKVQGKTNAKTFNRKKNQL